MKECTIWSTELFKLCPRRTRTNAIDVIYSLSKILTKKTMVIVIHILFFCSFDSFFNQLKEKFSVDMDFSKVELTFYSRIFNSMNRIKDPDGSMDSNVVRIWIFQSNFETSIFDESKIEQPVDHWTAVNIMT
jgi:hypothetical protein